MEVVFAPIQRFHPTSNRLKKEGNPQTNNLAELRVVLGALRLRWIEEGIQEDTHTL